MCRSILVNNTLSVFHDSALALGADFLSTLEGYKRELHVMRGLLDRRLVLRLRAGVHQLTSRVLSIGFKLQEEQRDAQESSLR